MPILLCLPLQNCTSIFSILSSPSQDPLIIQPTKEPSVDRAQEGGLGDSREARHQEDRRRHHRESPVRLEEAAFPENGAEDHLLDLEAERETGRVEAGRACLRGAGLVAYCSDRVGKEALEERHDHREELEVHKMSAGVNCDYTRSISAEWWFGRERTRKALWHLARRTTRHTKWRGWATYTK